MSICLYIAEKPSMAKDIAYVLGAKKREGIKWVGSGVWVSWCIGHLVGIAPPGAHDPKWKSWRPDRLPILPDELKWEESKRTQSHLRALKSLIRDRQVQSIVNACDAGREGELIFRTVYQYAGGRAPVRRFWVSSLTPSAIRTGLNQLRPSADFDALGAAAYCRAEADWLVGMNATRALTARADDLLSVGRVQTPTLAMVVHRAQEIRAFQPENYWLVDAILETQKGEEWSARWVGFTQDQTHRVDTKPKQKTTKGRINTRSLAEEISARIQDQVGQVTQMKGREESTPPPQLYHLTALQQEGNRRFGYSADDVLKFAQSLYEKHKVISYPRTDSRYLTPDLIPQLPQILNSIPAPLNTYAARLKAKGLPRLSGRYINAKKVNDHHGILPTTKTPNVHKMNQGEQRIYDLIARSLLAALSPPAIDSVTEIEAEIIGCIFWAKGKICLQSGWRQIILPPKKPPKEIILPQVTVGTPTRARSAKILDRQTQPPKSYTEATLLGAMEHAGSKLEEVSLKKAMKTSGLGTPATRASILETLIRRGYLKRISKVLEPTETGEILISAMTSEDLRSPTLTAQWEHQLQQIADGLLNPDHFQSHVRSWISQLTQNLLEGSKITVPHSKRKRDSTRRRGGQAQKRETQKRETQKRGSQSSSGGDWRQFAQKKSSPSRIDQERKSETSPSKKKIPLEIVGLRCPLCKAGHMIRGQRGWGCDQWRAGCTFVIWFQFEGVEIPEDEAIRVAYRGQSRLFYKRDEQKWRLCFDAHSPQYLRWESNINRKKTSGSTSTVRTKTKKGRGSKKRTYTESSAYKKSRWSKS